MRKKIKIHFNFVHLILFLYIILEILLGLFCDQFIYARIVNPIFWTAMAIFLFFYTENSHGRFQNMKSVYKTMFIIVMIYIIINVLLGFLFGFSYSPYSTTFTSIIKNVWQYVVPVIGIEYTRSYIVNYNSKNRLYILLVMIAFMIFETNFTVLFKGFETSKDWFVYVSSVTLPVIFSNVVYCILSWYGSYKLVLIYRFPITFLRLVLPINVSLDWFMIGVRDVSVPSMICIYFYQTLHDKNDTEISRAKKKSFFAYIPFIAIAWALVLFVANVFDYEPVAVLSDSMLPLFGRGDVVVYKVMDDEELKKLEVNDIILYERDGQLIVHRITQKYKDLGEIYYMTKGDANNGVDDRPVEISQILGKYTFDIKFVGYPSVMLYELFNAKAVAPVETGGI